MGEKMLTLTGTLPRDLAQEVSTAIFSAAQRGMEVDEAVCVAVSVAADYARRSYGDRYLTDLAEVVMAQSGRPLREPTP